MNLPIGLKGAKSKCGFAGDPQEFGQPNDPMVGKPIGRVTVFGGGLPLYEAYGVLVGGLGVSRDTACADSWLCLALPIGPYCCRSEARSFLKAMAAACDLPQWHMASIKGRRDFPRGVIAYSTRGGVSGCTVRSTIPAL